MERRVPITVEEAVRKVMGFAHNGLKELLPIELAYGRILAEDLVADHDVPSFNRSPYDGFAIRAKFMKVIQIQLFSTLTNVIFFAYSAIDSDIIFPVINSPPANTTSMSPTGKTAPPKTFTKLPQRSGKLPKTRMLSKKPSEINAPPKKPRISIAGKV